MPNLNVSDFLGDSVHANGLRQLLPVEDKQMVFRNWAQDLFSLHIEDNCPSCGSYSLDYLSKLLGGCGETCGKKNICGITSAFCVPNLQQREPHTLGYLLSSYH